MKTKNTINMTDNLQNRFGRYQKILSRMTLMDDIFMRNVLKKRECLECILQIIMDNPDLTVIDQVVQHDYKNLQGRSAILDCVARDRDGKLMNLEIQQDNEGASPKRARYHSGLMDMNTLEPGQGFDKLPESYVIFITRNDVLGYGLPIYHIKRMIDEVNKPFNDKSHIIYVNSSIQDDTMLGRLMHDMHCTNADEIYNSELADRVRTLKETEKGVNYMCSEMEQLYNEGIEEGKKLMSLSMNQLYNEGIEEGKKLMSLSMDQLYNEGIEQGIELGKEQGIAVGEQQGKAAGKAAGEAAIITNMYNNGLSPDQIALYVSKELSEVQNIINGINA